MFPWPLANLPANDVKRTDDVFATISNHRLKRGVFRSIVDLQAAINCFLHETNDDPKPFNWTADSAKIIAAENAGIKY